VRVSISNRQTEISLQVRPLRSRLERALTLLPRPLPGGLDEIAIVLVDRATIARVHADFLGDPSETDVITFPYGEILVCPAVAREQAPKHGAALENEVLLYALHGILHLTGYDDTTPAAAREMAKAQDALLRKVRRKPLS
jgi:probable rRNA maturation factor